MTESSDVKPARRRVLFMAEAATLAHVARPHVLAKLLPESQYDLLFACDPRYERLFLDARYPRRAINTIPSERFLAALANGSPLYDFATLRGYVEEDLNVIDEFRPDAIIGDFRLSLSVSARLRDVPYTAISNAYWNPHANIEAIVPALPFTRWLGYRLGGTLFRWASPIGFAAHARALNRLRKHYGMKPLGPDVRRYYTDGDQVLYSDLEELVPLRHRPDRHHFVGPILWSPEITLPPWWDEIPQRTGPTVYVTLGSSGASEIMPQLLRGLSRFADTVLVATAGRGSELTSGENRFVADYLPGDQAASLSDLVVCNGGSPTTYQALAAGKPVLGIPSNLDQCLNMSAVSRAGLGEILRIGEITEKRIVDAAQRLTSSDSRRAAVNASQKIESGRLQLTARVTDFA